MFEKQTKTDREGTMNSTENLIKIENYNLNETFLGGLYNKLVENSPDRVPTGATQHEIGYQHLSRNSEIHGPGNLHF